MRSQASICSGAKGSIQEGDIVRFDGSPERECYNWAEGTVRSGPRQHQTTPAEMQGDAALPLWPPLVAIPCLPPSASSLALVCCLQVETGGLDGTEVIVEVGGSGSLPVPAKPSSFQPNHSSQALKAKMFVFPMRPGLLQFGCHEPRVLPRYRAAAKRAMQEPRRGLLLLL